MKIKRLLKKYNKICKKASAIHNEIMNRYEEAYLINDTMDRIMYTGENVCEICISAINTFIRLNLKKKGR